MKKIVFGLLLLGTTSLEAASYRIVELQPPVANSRTETQGLGISGSGCYVAGSENGPGGAGAVRWAGCDSFVPELLGIGGLANSVNNSGTAVGGLGSQAVLWSLTSGVSPIPAPLAAPPSGRCVIAHAINDQGKVVGWYSEGVLASGPVEAPGWAFSWAADEGTALYDGLYRLSLGSEAYAVNNEGAIVGKAEVVPWGTVIGTQQAYHWKPTYLLGATPTDEGPGGSQASGLNDLGAAVGTDQGLAALWNASGIVHLGVTGRATDINNAGVIVGTASSAGGGSYAFVKRGSLVENLNDLVAPGSGWSLVEATGISENGWIVGFGRRVDRTPSEKNSRGSSKSLEGEEESPAPGGVIRGFVLIPLNLIR